LIPEVLDYKGKGRKSSATCCKHSLPAKWACGWSPAACAHAASKALMQDVCSPRCAAVAVWLGWVMDAGEGCVWKRAPKSTGSRGGRCQHFLPAHTGRTDWEKPWLSPTLRTVLPFQLDYSKNTLIFHKIIISFLSKYSYSGS